MLDPRICEKARLARDQRFDGLFFTGVHSTGVFCRPICPAPQPKAANVVYYPSAAAAIAAGLRPCLRCRPEAAPGTPAWNGTSATVARALNLIRTGALDEGDVEALADRLGVGSRHLRRLFRQHVGASPLAMANTQRVLFAKKLLGETDWPVTRIALATGFGSLRRFNAVFRKIYRQPPSAFRRTQQRPALPQPAHFHCRLTLSYRPPLDWDAMLSFYRLRAIAGVEGVDGHSYRRCIRTANGNGLIDVRAGSGDALRLEVLLTDGGDLLSVVEQARRIFDLDANLQAVQQTLAADSAMAPLIERCPGMRLPGAWDPFECAVRAVVGQQIAVKAACTIVGRIAHLAGDPIGLPNAFGLTRCFPTPQAVAAADLNAVGLPGGRLRALQNLAQAVAVDPTLLEIRGTLEDFVDRLSALPGIGRWTAHYIALRGLGEPDAFPESDLGLARALAENGVRPALKQIRVKAEAWRPWRGYAAVCLWNSALKAQGER